MSTRPRLKFVVIAVAASCAGVAAYAQRTVPVLPTLGAGFDTSGHGCPTGSTRALSALRPMPSRSPGGLLYERPPGEHGPRDDAAWSLDGCVELGPLVGDNDEPSALFRAYRDLDGNTPVSVYSLNAAADGGARFVELGGGNVGRDDQYYGLRLGRANDWSVGIFYTDIPHVFTDRFRSLWQGVGGAELTLADAALAAGGSTSAAETQAALRSVLAATPDSTLEVKRSKGGMVLGARLTDAWRAFLSLTNERRHGARPFGAVFGGGDGGGNIEVPQSVDDSSQEVAAGASYADARTSLNFVLTAAAYRNRIGSLTFANPLTITPSGIDGIGASAFTQGRFALDPDNDFMSARLDFARSIPDWYDARMTASIAVGRLRQDGALLAPTSLALAGATIDGIAADGGWNSAAALTRSQADARIDTQLAAFSASLQPVPRLSLIARYRDDSTDNDTGYQACNPLTGQLGRLLNDGSGTALVDVPAYLSSRCDLAAIRALGITPDAGDITLRSTPFEQRTRSYTLTADWRLRTSASLTTDIERTQTERRKRERARTWEDRLKLSYVERGLADVVVRASVEYAERNGGAYDNDAHSGLTSASLGPLPTAGNVSTWFGSVDDLRKYDLADRDRTILRLRADFAAAEGLDVGLSFAGRYLRYPSSEIGRSGREQQNSVGIDANFVAAGGVSLHGFYSYQSSRMEQVGAQPAGCLIGIAGVTADNFTQCGAFGGPLFPRERAWQALSSDRSQVFGAAGQFEFGWGVLDIDYTYSSARTSIRYAHGSGIFLSPERAALAGSGWPDLRFRQSVFGIGARIPLQARLSLRLRLQFESGQVDDWHYDGVDANPVPLANTVYLIGAPQEYHAAFGAVLLRLEL